MNNIPDTPAIVFATNNPHKLSEARRLAGDDIRILSLDEIGCHDDIPETAPDLEGNSLIKARWVKEKYGFDCFADDTGLFVEALDGAPGVLSARFAGPQCSAEDNMTLLLDRLKDEDNRRAAFRTVITLIQRDETSVFEGRVEGSISRSLHGAEGFGYDPIFIPDESGVAFAEMSPDAKNSISHRGRAVRKLFDYLLK